MIISERKWHDLRLKWDEEDGRNHSFLSLADELEGIFDEKGYFNSTMRERWRLVPIVWSMRSAILPPPLKKKGHLLLRCDCAVPLLILERIWWCGLLSHLSTGSCLFLSPVPRRNHVNLSSHLREAQALGVIMTDRRLPMGRGCAWRAHTYIHVCTRAHTHVPSTPLYSKLAEQSPHSSRP